MLRLALAERVQGVNLESDRGTEILPGHPREVQVADNNVAPWQ